jgi:hypothetical protein
MQVPVIVICCCMQPRLAACRALAEMKADEAGGVYCWRQLAPFIMTLTAYVDWSCLNSVVWHCRRVVLLSHQLLLAFMA